MRGKLRVKRSTHAKDCVPRGVNGTYDPNKSFTFQILHWEAFDEGLVNAPESEGHGRVNRCFDEQRQHTVYITGSTGGGNGVTLRTTFEPYFLLKLEKPRSGRRWTENEIRWLINTQLIFKEKRRTVPDWYAAEHPDEPEIEQAPRYYQVYSDPDNPDEEERNESKVFLSYESGWCGWEELDLKDLDAGFTLDVEKFRKTAVLDPLNFQFIKLKFTTLAECWTR
jgi:hypothetical protein